ncbi:efflux transporter outer membrane subunit [Amantichitinum ursilacus]|uniref:Outer membrane protein OprM n=1 Tax=Amantichitinum ursilacus TaxID=857265 RepID=A0A0N0XFZ4_9NEIS|nr:efflux transporter outer membrane subunit [Amantichitinum ursilacus]KPC49569.1 Outer membrane protein OprM precursor [Amantichitinum ursilacus]
MIKRRLTLALPALMLLASCALMQPDTRAPASDLPTSTVDSAWISPQWWAQFGDEQLNQLIAQARASNQNLAQAVARVAQARAALNINQSAQWPQLGVGADAGRQRVPPTASTTPGVYDSYQLAAQASWEIDVWGRLANLTEAARRDWLAAQYNQEAVRLSLDAEVAQTWFNLLSLDAQLSIASDTVQSRQQSLALQQKRFTGGLISELDVRQAEAELNTAQSTLPDIFTQRAATETALAILLGQTPAQISTIDSSRPTTLANIKPPLPIPAGLPADLLERRPDIQQAEAQLIAARARIEAARAAYFPQISLTGLFGLQSAAFGDLFTGAARTWSYAGNLTLPLFNGGLTAAQVNQARAVEQEALAAYRGSVQQAFGDVRNALVADQQGTLKTTAQAEKVKALTRQLHLANLRYDNGYSDYLDVLDTERSLFDARLSLVQARVAELNNRVALYKAVGGGWQAPAGLAAQH